MKKVSNSIHKRYPSFFHVEEVKFKKNQRVTTLKDLTSPINYNHNKYSGQELYCLKDCRGNYVHFLPVGKTIYDVEREPFVHIDHVIPYTKLHLILYGVDKI